MDDVSNGKRYIVIVGTLYPKESPGRVPRSLDEAMKELNESQKCNSPVYLAEILMTTGAGHKGKIVEYK